MRFAMLDFYNYYRSEIPLFYYRLRSLSENQRKELKRSLKIEIEHTDLYNDYISDDLVDEYLKKYYFPSHKEPNQAYYQTPQAQRLMLFIDINLLRKPNENGFAGYERREPWRTGKSQYGL